jgi:energy-coupling factor transporter ATP-binding protein EcfA2
MFSACGLVRLGVPRLAGACLSFDVPGHQGYGSQLDTVYFRICERHTAQFSSHATAPRKFSSLSLRDWRQFVRVDLTFHPTLTVLTGANASGKTTILNILGSHFDWPTNLLGTPVKTSSGEIRWAVDSREPRDGWKPDAAPRYIGTLTYELQGAPISRPLNIHPSQQYQVSVAEEPIFVPGIFVPSHRPLSIYQPLSALPLEFFSSELLLRRYVDQLRAQANGEHSSGTPLTSMKEALLAAAIYGEGNSSVERNPEARRVWLEFQEVLHHILPAELNFERLLVRLPDIVVCTRTSQFLLESLSGGINAIIELSWQIFLQSRGRGSFTACIDEPENHLHPSMQRSLLPQLIKAFPHVTFIVATHSPFIVTAVPDSNVYVLDNDRDERGIVSHLLDTANKAATSDETLRRVLGLDTTIPLWVEESLQQVLSEFSSPNLTRDDLEELRQKLIDLGLHEQFPNAVDSLIQEDTQA